MGSTANDPPDAGDRAPSDADPALTHCGRSHTRRPARLRASVEHLDPPWRCETLVENIGLGGACLIIGQYVSSEDILAVSFITPATWDPLVLRGRVAWVRTDEAMRRVGLAFEHESAQAVLALYELIVALAYE